MELDSTNNSSSGPTSPSPATNKIVDSLDLSSEEKDILKELIDSNKANLQFQRARPKGYSKGSHSPYYKKDNALLYLPALDWMIVNRKPILFRYDTMPDVKRETMKARIYQGLLYIVDHLDTDKKEGELEGKYGKLMDEVEVSSNYSDAGISLIFNANRKGLEIEKDSTTGGIKFVPLEDKENLNDWKQRLENTLSTIKVGDSPVRIVGMALSQEEIQSLQEELVEIKGLVYVIKSDKIELARVAITE